MPPVSIRALWLLVHLTPSRLFLQGGNNFTIIISLVGEQLGGKRVVTTLRDGDKVYNKRKSLSQ